MLLMVVAFKVILILQSYRTRRQQVRRNKMNCCPPMSLAIDREKDRHLVDVNIKLENKTTNILFVESNSTSISKHWYTNFRVQLTI
jgi:hypothetical protein